LNGWICFWNTETRSGSNSHNACTRRAGKQWFWGKGVVPAALLPRAPVMSSVMRSNATNGVETPPIGWQGVCTEPF
jgi:hypothetical protein